MQHRCYILWILLLILFFSRQSSACRYTVREIGYTDLAAAPYQLYLVFENDSNKMTYEELNALRYAVLLNSNIQTKLIYRPAFDSLKIDSAINCPAAVLVSPTGRSLILDIPETDSFKESVWQLLESLAESRVRKTILNELKSSFGIILLVEGNNRKAFGEIQAEAEKSVKNFSLIQPLLPGQVESKILTITIPRENRTEEKLLLWSLGIEVADSVNHLAVMYGRGRKIGPVLRGSEISSQKITNLLSLIGADCECSIDQSWKLGMMIPCNPGSAYNSEVSALLGFDPEHPLVKAEISQILHINTKLKLKKIRKINPLEVNVIENNQELESRQITISVKIGIILFILTAGFAILIVVFRYRK